MSAKTSAEVVIDGKVYTLSGYEGEEYLQKVASYINGKINEFTSIEEYRHCPAASSFASLRASSSESTRFG